MNSEIIRAIFDCGVDDLNLLDDAEVNFFDVIKEMRFEGIDTTMNNIIREVFGRGRQVIADRYDAMMLKLLNDEKAGELTEGTYEQLQELKELDPNNDFTFWINLQDTNFHGDSSKQEIYEKYFEEELEECMRITGYDIEW